MDSKPSWLSVTNILVSIALSINAIVFFQMNSISDKMFLHLTNATIHIPRETVVSKDEFAIYQAMRDNQMSDMKCTLFEIRNDIKEKLKGK